MKIQPMTDKKLKEKFIEILKFNMLEPTIDPEDGNFEDHLSIQLWKLFADELAQAKAEERSKLLLELLQVFNDYDVPLTMTAKQVRSILGGI